MKKMILTAIIAILGISLNAESFVIQDRAEVIRSKPIYRNIIKRIPYQECRDEQVPITSYYNGGGNNSGIGALIGGVAGGIIGHQIGGGNGKTVAMVGGAILGTLVGNNLSRRNNKISYVSGYRRERKCVTRHNESYVKEIIRYKNIAYYKGIKIIKFSDKPLRFIRIRTIIKY